MARASTTCLRALRARAAPPPPAVDGGVARARRALGFRFQSALAAGHGRRSCSPHAPAGVARRGLARAAGCLSATLAPQHLILARTQRDRHALPILLRAGVAGRAAHGGVQVLCRAAWPRQAAARHARTLRRRARLGPGRPTAGHVRRAPPARARPRRAIAPGAALPRPLPAVTRFASVEAFSVLSCLTDAPASLLLHP